MTVFVYLCTCIYVCLYVCCVFICLCVYMFVCTVCVCLRVCLRMCMYVNNIYIYTAVSVTTDLGDTIFELQVSLHKSTASNLSYITQATDPENGDFGVIWYRSVIPDARFNISRETGNIVSNQISQGKAGSSFKYEVEAYDNKGKQPSLSTREVITVRHKR